MMQPEWLNNLLRPLCSKGIDTYDHFMYKWFYPTSNGSQIYEYIAMSEMLLIQKLHQQQLNRLNR